MQHTYVRTYITNGMHELILYIDLCHGMSNEVGGASLGWIHYTMGCCIALHVLHNECEKNLKNTIYVILSPLILNFTHPVVALKC